MKEILTDVDSWLDSGKTNIAMATVVQTWGSAPRKTGAKMAINSDGQITGSVSGGCVEGAVIEAAMETLESGSAKLLHFGVADEVAWNVGLACGGTIDIFVEKLDEPTYQYAHQKISKNQPAIIVSVIQAPENLIGSKATLDGDKFWFNGRDEELSDQIQQALRGINRADRVRIGEKVELFVDVIQPELTLIIVGGVHVAIALTAMAKILNYRTFIIDPRRSFGSQERFPDVDLLIQKWPQKAFEEVNLTPDTAVALLTHDPKIDDPSLKILLDSPVFYLGALGSQKTHTNRKDRLQKMGFSEEKISTIYAPIGLDIGANTPEEIALAVLGEIVQARHKAHF